ncbi:uncharacterized protein [Ptychodera flava]|uniref:uncharacterized protein n=1 Tax=Ptychodera flava TaxID=63121 RepID=UPI00396A690D
MISFKISSLVFCAWLSLQENKADTTLHKNRDICGTLVEGSSFSKKLTEVSLIGTEIVVIETSNDNPTSHFFIEETTNKDGRFDVSNNGTVYLSGYLDFDIDQNYTLSVLSYDGLNATGEGVCVKHTIEVTVVDDEHWPRPFNESCCACQKDKSRYRPDDYPFVGQVFLGAHNVPCNKECANLWIDRCYLDVTDDCRFSIYIVVDGLPLQNVVRLFAGTVPLNTISFTCEELNSEHATTIYGGRLLSYESLDSLATHLQRNRWFLSNQNSHFVRLDFSDEFSRRFVLQEETVTCDMWLPGRNYRFDTTGRFRMLGCPDGYFGMDCSEVCICKNGATCHALRGSCKCAPGWRGPACDIRHSEVLLNASDWEVFIGDQKILQAQTYNIVLMNSTVTWYLNGSDSFRKTQSILQSVLTQGKAKYHQ